MWTIRQEQADTFRKTALQKFEDEMVEHLKKSYAEHWKVMGEEAGRRVIQLGIDQAKKHGFTNRGPVRFYIELMFMFGSYFDTDPQYPWASAVLTDSENVDQTVRADRLYVAMNEYLAQVVEPEREHLRAAVQRLMPSRVEDVLKPGVNLEEMILQMLRSICPVRCEYSGDSVLRTLVQHGFGLARRYGFTTDKGMVLMVVLTFAVGHGFYKDPLNGWIVRRLENPRWPDVNKRVDDLSSKSLLYLKYILASRSER
jgi:hypothetical protein